MEKGRLKMDRKYSGITVEKAIKAVVTIQYTIR